VRGLKEPRNKGKENSMKELLNYTVQFLLSLSIICTYYLIKDKIHNRKRYFIIYYSAYISGELKHRIHYYNGLRGFPNLKETLAHISEIMQLHVDEIHIKNIQ